MNKTLRNKLTAQHTHSLTSTVSSVGTGNTSTPAAGQRVDLKDDRNILNEVAKDLLQPRTEAVDRILAMAREM